MITLSARGKAVAGAIDGPWSSRFTSDMALTPNNQQVARAGEHFVAAGLHRRGAYAVTFAGKHAARIDILATDHRSSDESLAYR